jgi:hypothetical protein
MKKGLILLSFILIGLVLLCGCSTQSNVSNSVFPSDSTQKTQFSINEPATVGNLRITVLGEPSERINEYYKMKTITFNLLLQNLRSDRTLYLETYDFELVPPENYFRSQAQSLGNSWDIELGPGQTEKVELVFIINLNDNISTFMYEPCIKCGVDGPTVYFNS